MNLRACHRGLDQRVDQGSGHRNGVAQTGVTASCARRLRHSVHPSSNGRSAASPAAGHLAPVRQQQKSRVRTQAAAVGDVQPADEMAAQQSAGTLERLLSWAIANGVQGLGAAGSKVALYEEDDGERGVVCVEPIAAGEVFLRVPLRLAITNAPTGDSNDDADARLSAALPGGGTRWQDRLAAKLLRVVAEGPASPWYPYILALPKRVPSALDTFACTPGALEAVEYPPAMARIQAHPALMAAKWREVTARCPEAIGGADLERFRWAHTMLNHAGDRTEGLLSDEALAADNVRWDVLSPTNPNNGTGEWEMAVSAKRDVDPGEPLALSYFEGSNDEFLLHYGFVPPCNPHDEVELAPNLQAALEQLWRIEAATAASADASTSSSLGAAYLAALSAGQDALRHEVEEALARTGAGPDATSDEAASSAASEAADAIIDSLEVIKVASGSRISNSLVAALEALAPAFGSDDESSSSGSGGASGGVGGSAGSRVEFLVAALCWLVLRDMPTPLVVDLAALLLDGAAMVEEDGGAAASAAATQLQHYHSLLSSSSSSSSSSAGINSEEGLLTLARGLIEDQGGASAAALLSSPLSHELRSAVTYRAAKKMGLVDVISAVAAARRESVVELQARIQAWAAAAAAAGNGTSGAGRGGTTVPPPPWQAGLLFDAGLQAA